VVGQVVTDRPFNEMVCPVIHDASLFFGAGSGGDRDDATKTAVTHSIDDGAPPQSPGVCR